MLKDLKFLDTLCLNIFTSRMLAPTNDFKFCFENLEQKLKLIYQNSAANNTLCMLETIDFIVIRGGFAPQARFFKIIS